MESGVFIKEKKMTLRDKATEQLRSVILSGKLAPGTRLIEQDLSREMGISRLPIREAIFHLEQEGLVTIEPYKGAFVSHISSQEIDELYSIRILLEVHALTLFMKKNCVKSLEVLEDILVQMSETQADNTVSIAFYDFEFHKALCKLCEHDTLYKLWSTLVCRIQTYMNIEMQNKSTPTIRENHVKLLEIIKSGDINAASIELTSHLHRGCNSLQNAHKKNSN